MSSEECNVTNKNNTLLERINDINFNIFKRRISKLSELKNVYLRLLKDIEVGKVVLYQSIDKTAVKEEVEKSFALSARYLKNLSWGEFAALNPKKHPNLYSIMIDKNGELLRTYDNFTGTVAAMDFHGYTQFSNDIKYNKTPLQEFGDSMPQKIEAICEKCGVIVYEIEGDALILIGPEDPINITTAVLSIIELARQKPFNKDPKQFHGLDIKNPMIKPFELNAAITTGGETFINRNGHIIGAIIAEANRILKIINTKKPNRSGIMLSDKVWRKLNKLNIEKVSAHISIFDFKETAPLMVDVKGMRLNIREILVDDRKYYQDAHELMAKLNEEIKKKSPSKWYNILIYYVSLIKTALRDIKCSIVYNGEKTGSDKIRKILQEKLDIISTEIRPEAISDILTISALLYNGSEDIRDIIAVYYEMIQENYRFIKDKLDGFYSRNLEDKARNSPPTAKIIGSYLNEIETIKRIFPPRRVYETILTNIGADNLLIDVPYLGKK